MMNPLRSITGLVLATMPAGVLLLAEPVSQTGDASIVAASGFIQSAILDPSRPFFIPTHPRVTTTIRFPSAIGAPDGRGFTEDESKQPGEYLVSWSPGDPHFTLTPLRNAGPLNLNVPYRGSTYVLYFYPVERQFDAVASLNLTSPPTAPPPEPQGIEKVPILRTNASPAAPAKLVSPSRMLGIIDRLKLVGSLAPGDRLAKLVAELDVELALCGPDKANTPSPAPSQVPPGIVAWLQPSVTNFGLFELRLLRVLRDGKLNSLGFALRVRNRSDQAIALDLSSFAARAGSIYLPQFVSDAPPILAAGEESEVYFAAKCPSSIPLLAANEWQISVDLLSPLLNPGAAFVREFAKGKK